MKSNFQYFKWTLLVCFTTMFFSCASIPEYKDWGLKCNVKSYSEYHYRSEKEEDENIKFYGHNQVVFNKKGIWKGQTYYQNGKELPIRKKGKVSERRYYDADGKLTNTTKINYVSDNQIDFELFNSDGEKTNYLTHILKNGKIITQTNTSIRNGIENLVYTAIYEYDKDENLITQKITYSNGNTHIFKTEYLEFDSKKNWIKKLNFTDDEKGGLVTIREIEYH